MSAAVKSKAPIAIPDKVRRRAGIRPGEEVEFRPFRGGVAVLGRRLTTEARERLTPDQARKLRHALKQIRKGNTAPWSQVKDELGL